MPLKVNPEIFYEIKFSWFLGKLAYSFITVLETQVSWSLILTLSFSWSVWFRSWDSATRCVTRWFMPPSTPPSRGTCWLSSPEDGAPAEEVAAVESVAVGPGGVTNEWAYQQWSQSNPDGAWRRHLDKERSGHGVNQHGKPNQRGLRLTRFPPWIFLVPSDPKRPSVPWYLALLTLHTQTARLVLTSPLTWWLKEF